MELMELFTFGRISTLLKFNVLLKVNVKVKYFSDVQCFASTYILYAFGEGISGSFACKRSFSSSNLLWAKWKYDTHSFQVDKDFISTFFLLRLLGEKEAKLVQHQSHRRFVGSDLCFTKNVKETLFAFTFHAAVFSNNKNAETHWMSQKCNTRFHNNKVADFFVNFFWNTSYMLNLQLVLVSDKSLRQYESFQKWQVHGLASEWRAADEDALVENRSNVIESSSNCHQCRFGAWHSG